MDTIESWDTLHARARSAELRIATHHTAPDGGGLVVTVSSGARLVMSLIVAGSAPGDRTARAALSAGLDAEGVARGLAACPRCGAAWVERGDEQMTTGARLQVDRPGHDHDRNCLTRSYLCGSGHRFTIGKLRRCPAVDCAWRGLPRCVCADFDFVHDWPEVAASGDQAVARG